MLCWYALKAIYYRWTFTVICELHKRAICFLQNTSNLLRLFGILCFLHNNWRNLLNPNLNTCLMAERLLKTSHYLLFRTKRTEKSYCVYYERYCVDDIIHDFSGNGTSSLHFIFTEQNIKRMMWFLFGSLTNKHVPAMSGESTWESIKGHNSYL